MADHDLSRYRIMASYILTYDILCLLCCKLKYLDCLYFINSGTLNAIRSCEMYEISDAVFTCRAKDSDSPTVPPSKESFWTMQNIAAKRMIKSPISSAHRQIHLQENGFIYENKQLIIDYN